MKKLLVTTALSGLMISAALAQAPSSSSSPSSPPSASPPAASSSDSMKSDAPKASTSGSAESSKSTTGSASTISAQKPDQLLVSNLKGVDVMGSDDKKVGDISDILFTKEGKVEAFLISVGGFLGVGAKEIALAPSQIQLQEESGSWKAKVSMNKDQLAQAPNFERYKEKPTTTGSGMGSGGSATTPRSAPTPPPASNRP